MSNEEYQSLFAHRGAELRRRFLNGADQAVQRGATHRADDDVAPGWCSISGGHDLGLLIHSYRSCDDVADRPSELFAYTIRAGLPMAGDPLNDSLLLSASRSTSCGRRSASTPTRAGPGRP